MKKRLTLVFVALALTGIARPTVMADQITVTAPARRFGHEGSDEGSPTSAVIPGDRRR